MALKTFLLSVDRANIPPVKVKTNSMDLNKNRNSLAEGVVSSSKKPTPLLEIDASASEGTHQQPEDKGADEVCDITPGAKKEALSENCEKDLDTPLVVSFMNGFSP